MKQVLVKGGKVAIEEVPPPSAAPGMVLVRVRRSLISSGTESGFVSGGGAAGYLLKKARDPLNVEKVKRKLASIGVRGTWDLVKNKLFEFQAPGYSTAGVAVAVGEGVDGIRAGDRVACAGVGYATHAEYNLVPRALATPIPDGVDFDEAAFVTLGAIAMQGVRQAHPTLGETVVVLGLGLLGQLAAQIARAAGCHVIGCDPVEARRALALELGAEFACAPEALEDAVSDATGGVGADAVIVCAASKESAVTNQAIEICRQKGRVAVVGAVGLQLQREALYMKEIDFRLSCSYGPGRYQPAYEERGLDYPIGHVRWTEGRNMAEFLRMIAGGRVKVRPLLGAVEPVDAAQAAYDAALSGAAIAAQIDYGAEDAPATPPSHTLVVRAKAAREGVGVAVIGAGGFASAHHLPNLGRIAGARLEAVVNRTGGKAKQAAEKFGARYCTTDYREALVDPKVDAVVVATRHNLHTEICLAAIAAGKHVFVEKPLAITVEDCEAIRDAAAAAGVLVTVGFNRRFSPHARALKESLRGGGPKMLLYRVNAGALPPNHWAADPVEGGGRIVGEGVHFYDFCCWLLDADPVAVRAERIAVDSAGIVAEDNVSALLRFPDGSTATVLYTALGHPGLGKERVEAFAGGGGAVLEDFRGVAFHGLPGATRKPGMEDKGQRGILENFIDAVRGKAPLDVTADHGLRATRIARDILAHARGDA